MEHTEAHESAGTDSFLDVTTNIVGILIILVMIVGVRAQNPIVPGSAELGSEEKIKTLSHQAANVEYEARRAQEQMQVVENEIRLKGEQRQVLATLVSAGEHQIEEARSRLASEDQADFDLRQQLEEVRSTVARQTADLTALQQIKTPITEVRQYPVPISRLVNDRIISFRILEGRIAFIPMDDFLEDIRSELRRSGRDVENLTKSVGVVGPRNGFKLRYTLSTMTERGRIVGIDLKEFEFIPVEPDLGESIVTALQQQSAFKSALASHNPRNTTIRLAVYSDSFLQYQPVKEALHEMGYAVVVAPIPVGLNILGGADAPNAMAQ